MTTASSEPLAVNGGTPTRTAPWPLRHLYGEAEKQAAMRLFDKCIESGGIIGYNGEEEEAYCVEFATFLGGGYADGVNSGTTALYVALRALELPPFSEVITPPITDPGGCMPVPLLNLIPIPADAAPGSYNAGPEQIAARITKRTSAIVVAHISGHACDMEPIMALARKHGLPVIEDCAQSHGATYRGEMLGTIGNIAAFSTMSGKHHSTGPQGGVVFTSDELLRYKIRQASDRGKPFGVENARGNVMASLNLNSNDLAAAIGRVQLKKLPDILAGRRKFARLVAEGCQSLSTVSVNTGLPDTEGAYWFMLLKLELDKLSVDKATFAKAMNAEGIPCGAGYYHAPTEHPWAVEKRVFGQPGYPWTSPDYKGDANAVYALPNAKAADATHITLGMHERCGDQEAADVVAALAKLEAAYGG
jgi:dTDP-4-amino-4,6-dideoxygalactose transaminase